MQNKTVTLLIVLANSFCLVTDALATAPGLSDTERNYYGSVFAYAMDNVKSGDTYDWASYSIKGKISAGDPFKSKSGAFCRHYSESYAYEDKTGTSQGTACKRSSGEGWCKLKPGRELTACALEHAASGLEALKMPSWNSFLPDFPDIDFSVFTTPQVGEAPEMGYNGPGIDTTYRGSTPSGGEIADTVTGTAGSAAGTAAEGTKKWLGQPH